MLLFLLLYSASCSVLVYVSACIDLFYSNGFFVRVNLENCLIMIDFHPVHARASTPQGDNIAGKG